MPDRGADRRGLRHLAAGLIGLAVLAAAPLRAGPPDQLSLDLSARLEALAAALDDPKARARPGAVTIAQSGVIEAAGLPAAPVPAALMELPRPSGAPDAAAVLRRLDMRLALTMLSQGYGEAENAAVVMAQTEPALQALVVAEGHVGLSELRRALREQDLPHENQGAALILRVPLVIWPGAGLTLGPGEELRLSRSDGAFVANFGDLRLRGATVATVGEPNPNLRSFVPFVATAGSGTIDLQGARLYGLGFGETLKFTGFSVLRSLIVQPSRPSRIEDTLFEGVQTVTVGSDHGILIHGNQFHDARGPALVVSRSSGAQVLSNLFSGDMPTNAIRLEQGSDHGLVAGNVVLGGDYAGIVVRHASHAAELRGNIVWRRGGGGIAVLRSDCGRIEGNLVIDNDQKGIELRHSRGGLVLANRVFSNQSAAIWVSDQEPGTLTAIRDNTIAWNGAGLSAARGEGLLLDGNDMTQQFLQLLSGEIAPQSAHLARDMRGGSSMLLTASGVAQPPAELPPCGGEAS